jgi:hypothetical protein
MITPDPGLGAITRERFSQDGDLLKLKPPPAPHPPWRWLQRLEDWLTIRP